MVWWWGCAFALSILLVGSCLWGFGQCDRKNQFATPTATQSSRKDIRVCLFRDLLTIWWMTKNITDIRGAYNYIEFVFGFGT
jgi:hypothetical protein